MIHLKRLLQTNCLKNSFKTYVKHTGSLNLSKKLRLRFTCNGLCFFSGCPSSTTRYSGSFSSPNYPSYYYNNQRCSWGITVPSGYRVEVKFDTFRTYNRNDYLKIYDGSSSSSTQLTSLSGYQSTPRVYSSSGSSMWFSFYSDSSGTQKGFHATFTAITSSGRYCIQ